MNFLVIGAGGREHALAWKIKQSPKCNELFVSPGNAGTAQIATNLNIGVNEFDKISDAIRVFGIDMVVIGPEDPLVGGIVEKLAVDHPGLAVIGPGQEAAQLEGSKSFAKEFMNKFNIPTAKAKEVTSVNLEEGLSFLDSLKPPYVLKADGLAAGKGVIITKELDEAKSALKNLIVEKQFGEASSKVLIEEFLDGIELSVFVLTDGRSYKILPAAKDYKRIGEGDTGPNTGGMGAVSPVIFADEEFLRKVEEKIVIPTVEGIAAEGFNYKGFVFIGLMNCDGEPFVVEYNVRMGDPETQVVIPRIKSDLVDLLEATYSQNLDNVNIEILEKTATTVVMVSEGYPGSYEKGKSIEISDIPESDILFHAGTTGKKQLPFTNGGRVMAITGLGENLQEALSNSYVGIKSIQFEGMTYRSDIGKDLLNLGQ